MNFPVLRVLLCVFLFSAMLYAYVDSRNHLTEMRLRVPVLEKDLRSLQEENVRLRYEIERFESPIHLMELWRMPEFGHLKHPLLEDVIVLPQGREPADG